MSLLNSVFDGDDPNWAIAATQPAAPKAEVSTGDVSGDTTDSDQFVPRAPRSFEEAGLRDSQVEALTLKFLLNTGGNTGREIAHQLALPFGLMEPLLMTMKLEQLITHRSSASVGDYLYELAPRGFERARSYATQSTYFGAAPVTLDDYIESVEAQSLRHRKPTLGDIKRTFRHLTLGEDFLRRIGEAVNLGKGFFLYGAPGNGKTSVASHITNVFDEGIWIPRAIIASGQLIRLYDPIKHTQLEWKQEVSLLERSIDSRWVYVKRPTMLVGGELRLENLEVTTNEVTGISEAPIQLKSNGGTLVIDDFGRQKFEIEALLNRLIVPLERRQDILNLQSGRSFNIPFDLLIVFSTNLSPESLVDEAFLRRVPFTIRAADPTEQQFRDVFASVAEEMGLEYEPDVVDYLINKHYFDCQRPFRFCHPRDILLQVANSCDFSRSEKVITNERIDAAIENCLAIRLDRPVVEPPVI